MTEMLNAEDRALIDHILGNNVKGNNDATDLVKMVNRFFANGDDFTMSEDLIMRLVSALAKRVHVLEMNKRTRESTINNAIRTLRDV